MRKRVSAHCPKLWPEKAARQEALFEADLVERLMALVATPMMQMRWQVVHPAMVMLAPLLV
ncbi:MAG TPA: hypothetical protein PLK58_15150 [Candidatus Rifleibacterium sp.]|nr:hypothetical protein [Candidatus Rifleibacterium sp.]